MPNHQLDLFYRLLHGERLTKHQAAERYQVSEKTIQRDFRAIQKILQEHDADLTYHRSDHTFGLNRTNHLSPKIVLTILRVMLASRSLTKNEMNTVITTLTDLLPHDLADTITTFIANEQAGYKGLQHQQALLEVIWQMENWIKMQTVIDFEYMRDSGTVAHYTNGLPVALIADSYYFYVIIFFQNSKRHFYTYRLDRFMDITTKTNQSIVDAYLHNQALHFNEPKLRQENPLMQIGDRRTVTIKFTGILEALQDRFPNAQVLESKNGSVTVKIIGNWTAIKMWCLSQGPRVTILAPESCKTDYRETLEQMLAQNK